MTKRERGTGRIFQPRDPEDHTRHTQVWWIDYSIEGKRYRESSKSRKRSVAAALLKQRLGQAPEQAAARAQRLSFEDLEEGIQSRYELAGNRSTGRLRAAFKHLREHFAEWPARAITTEALQKYATQRLKNAAPATVRYELAVLRRAMKGRVNPRPDFPSIGVHNARVGFLELEEFEAVLGQLPEPLKGIALVGYYTGWRKSEILGLTWERVDFDHGTMRLEPTSTKAGTSTKNNQGRTFPFGELPPLAEVLEDRRAFTDEAQLHTGAIIPWVWHRADGSRICKIDEAWRAACRRAGYPGRLFHDLRRTAVRNLVRAGTPQHWAMELCGHKTPEVFRRYAITSEADLKQAVARLIAAPRKAGSQVIPLKSGA